MVLPHLLEFQQFLLWLLLSDHTRRLFRTIPLFVLILALSMNFVVLKCSIGIAFLENSVQDDMGLNIDRNENLKH